MFAQHFISLAVSAVISLSALLFTYYKTYHWRRKSRIDTHKASVGLETMGRYRGHVKEVLKEKNDAEAFYLDTGIHEPSADIRKFFEQAKHGLIVYWFFWVRLLMKFKDNSFVSMNSVSGFVLWSACALILVGSLYFAQHAYHIYLTCEQNKHQLYWVYAYLLEAIYPGFAIIMLTWARTYIYCKNLKPLIGWSSKVAGAPAETVSQTANGAQEAEPVRGAPAKGL